MNELELELDESEIAVLADGLGEEGEVDTKKLQTQDELGILLLLPKTE